MSSPKINKMILELEEGVTREYVWPKEKLSMAELTVMLNMLNKIPEGRWLDVEAD